LRTAASQHKLEMERLEHDRDELAKINEQMKKVNSILRTELEESKSRIQRNKDEINKLQHNISDISDMKIIRMSRENIDKVMSSSTMDLSDMKSSCMESATSTSSLYRSRSRSSVSRSRSYTTLQVDDHC